MCLVAPFFSTCRSRCGGLALDYVLTPVVARGRYIDRATHAQQRSLNWRWGTALAAGSPCARGSVPRLSLSLGAKTVGSCVDVDSYPDLQEKAVAAKQHLTKKIAAKILIPAMKIHLQRNIMKLWSDKILFWQSWILKRDGRDRGHEILRNIFNRKILKFLQILELVFCFDKRNGYLTD